MVLLILRGLEAFSTTNTTYTNRATFLAATNGTVLTESFDSLANFSSVSSVLSSRASFSPAALAFPGSWNMFGTGGTFSGIGLLPTPFFAGSPLITTFSSPVFGVGANVFDDFDGLILVNIITLTVTTSTGQIIIVSENNNTMGDCGFLGVTSTDGIVSAVFSISDLFGNLEVDQLTLLTEVPCTVDTDGDGVCNNIDNCVLVANANQADSDCDGVGDVCDQCDGGDDSLDSDSDGIPDCLDWSGINNLPEDWLCGNNDVKVIVAHDGTQLCISEAAVAAHLAIGDFLGLIADNPCGLVVRESGKAQELQNAASVLSLFPSPAEEQLNLVLEEPAKQVSIVIVDFTGKTVYKAILNNQETMVKILVRDLPGGLYQLHVLQEGMVTDSKKILIKKGLSF